MSTCIEQIKAGVNFTIRIEEINSIPTPRRDFGPVHTYRDIFESATFPYRIQKFPRPQDIRLVAEFLLSTLKSGFKTIRICRMRVEGSRIRKEEVADYKISGYA